jgi:hemerythrin-like metal-binding protein
MLVQWNESDSLGIPKIDQQHRELYQMLNELSEAMDSGRGKIAAAEIMPRLLPFISAHFSEEEAVLRERNAPTYRQCCARHHQQLSMIEFFLRHRRPTDLAAVIDLLYFLDCLLEGHIDGDRSTLGLQSTALIHRPTTRIQ